MYVFRLECVLCKNIVDMEIEKNETYRLIYSYVLNVNFQENCVKWYMTGRVFWIHFDYNIMQKETMFMDQQWQQRNVYSKTNRMFVHVFGFFLTFKVCCMVLAAVYLYLYIHKDKWWWMFVFCDGLTEEYTKFRWKTAW